MSWSVEEEDTWTVSRYRDDMRPGDVVALRTGGGSLAYAAALGVSSGLLIPDPPLDLDGWAVCRKSKCPPTWDDDLVEGSESVG